MRFSIARSGTSLTPRCPGPPGTARWPPTETPCLDRCGGYILDVLRLKTPHGDFDYVVRETAIVEPDDLWVLDPTPVSMLTLISCYPFNFIGNAPKRFIVRAERMPTRPQMSAKGWAR